MEIKFEANFVWIVFFFPKRKFKRHKVVNMMLRNGGYDFLEIMNEWVNRQKLVLANLEL